MNNVLFICPHFPPIAASGAFRMLGFARHLPKFGWSTSVIASSPVRWEPNDPQLAAQIPHEMSVTRVGFPQGRTAHWINRGVRAIGGHDGYWLWGRRAAAECRRLAKHAQVDAVLTSGPPHSVHRLGAMLKRRFGIPWIADFRDPWAGNAEARGTAASVLAREASVLRDADVVIANAPNAEKEFARRYPEFREKLTTITNGYDPESVLERRRIRAPGDPIEILHAGELYAGRDPKPLLDAIRDLRTTERGVPPFRVTFLGRGEWAGFRLSDEIEKHGLHDVVRMSGQVSYDEARQRMVDADVLLLLDSAKRTCGVPAKLYEYIGCNRPILALAEKEGDTAWALQAAHSASRIADPPDAVDIRGALLSLLQEIGTAAPDATPPGRTENAIFTRENTAKRLADVLDAMLQRTLTGCVGHDVIASETREFLNTSH